MKILHTKSIKTIEFGMNCLLTKKIAHKKTMNHFDSRFVFWEWWKTDVAIPQLLFLFKIQSVFHPITTKSKKKDFWNFFYTSNQNFKKPPIDPPRCQKWLTRVLANTIESASPHNAFPHIQLSMIKGGREPPRDLRRAYSDWNFSIFLFSLFFPLAKKKKRKKKKKVSSALPPYSPIRI